MKAAGALVSPNDITTKFIMTIPSSKGCFQNVTISDSKLMITLYDFYLRQMDHTLKLVKQVINLGDGILILYCYLV